MQSSQYAHHTDSVVVPLAGHGHISLTGVDLPKRTFHVLILTEYLSWPRSGDNQCSECFCHLACTALLEDRYQEDGMINASIILCTSIDRSQFLMACIMGTIIPAWGMIGLWTNKIGLDLTSSYSGQVICICILQVSQCLGVLGVQCCVWTRDGTKCLCHTDDDE